MNRIFQEESTSGGTAEERELDSPQAINDLNLLMQAALCVSSVRSEMEEILEEGREIAAALETSVRSLGDACKGNGALFSAPSDRRRFSDFCRMVRHLEEGSQSLRLLTSRLSVLALRVRACEMPRLRAEGMLATMPSAVWTKQNLDAEEMLERLRTERQACELFLSDVLRAVDGLTDFCDRTLPKFCERMATQADVIGEGKALRESALRQSCGELAFAIKALNAFLSNVLHSRGSIG